MKDLLNSLAGKLLLLAIAIVVAVILLSRPKGWNEAARKDFYSRDQGSRIMPLAWIQALKQPNGEPFLADSLSRYGYLPNPSSPTPGLPVGFVAAGPAGNRSIGMTCSACHTREINVNGTAYRIDGGPAIVDFQSFLDDLDKAVGAVLKTDAAFAAFAKAVGSGDPASLHAAVSLWYDRYHTLIEKALPTPAWGPSRLDAVAMIFNRLTGLDIGKPPSYLIAENIQPASAPVRYPFLWNAPVQDWTQWPGFAQNGNDLLGLSRNLGEVYGVFADFHPKQDATIPLLKVDYLADNSANFLGLLALENLVKRLAPPKWPFAVDASLAAQGKAIYARATDQGGCVDCHGIRQGEFRFPNQTWATPIQDVGTDSREYDTLKFVVKTGELQGARIPPLTSPLQPVDAAISVLATSVLGSILQELGQELGVPAVSTRTSQVLGESAPTMAGIASSSLKGAFTPVQRTGISYESRVLEGVWAVAPYLHNGSVPTLAELLKPAAERVKSFKIGPAYDTANVGLATEQTKFNYTLETTDCSDRNSGNSRCGHEYGTKLSSDEKRALLEYLKTL
jgi:mono/diheme cytochrome c family protein